MKTNVIKAIKKTIPKAVKNSVKYLFDERYREVERLRNLPAHESTTTDLLGHTVKITDAEKFIHMYQNIFREQIYKFDPINNPPCIIDGGANIGIATLYWKKEYPKSEIIALEPDPYIFEVLEYNVESNNLENTRLIQKGLWKEEKMFQFKQDRQDGGHFDLFPAKKSLGTCKVPTTRLSPFLEQKTDMLKLDIEGAEVEVVKDAEDKLVNVENMFVEFHSYPDKEQKLSELLKIIKRAEFRYHIMPGITSSNPFLERETHNGMDNTVNIFAYRT
jgi:FkbM family methyltransferase